jgi:chorismate dehydratase
MTPTRVGAVGFLNARPLVFGLDRDARFAVRFDLPSRCADLLHAGEIDLGLIPSIEYLRAPDADGYVIVPDLAIGSRGTVASVAIYTTREMRDVRTIALDTSSRTSVALTRVMCSRVFGIDPRLEDHGPDLVAMLERSDAALMIGDNALFEPGGPLELPAGGGRAARQVDVVKIDLGELWTRTTGLPFVYAVWAGRARVVSGDTVAALQRARDLGCAHTREIAEAFFPGDPDRQAVGERYLRDNVRYDLGSNERAGLERFYGYAVEAGVVPRARPPRFFGEQL